MCTVTYLPLEKKGFVLTSTRDEKTTRESAVPPQAYEIDDQTIIYPRDPQAHGTWIATSLTEYSLCLLNGGFLPHESKPPYRMSRGHVIRDFFRYGSPESMRNQFDFEGMEPFTLLIIGLTARSLDEIRWDGNQFHHTGLKPDKPEIWSSVTLYSEEIIRIRKNWFHDWLSKNPALNIENAVKFHKKAGIGDSANDIFMNRDHVRTVSITSILRSEETSEMYYEDTINGEITHLNKLKSNLSI